MIAMLELCPLGGFVIFFIVILDPTVLLLLCHGGSEILLVPGNQYLEIGGYIGAQTRTIYFFNPCIRALGALWMAKVPASQSYLPRFTYSQLMG